MLIIAMVTIPIFLLYLGDYDGATAQAEIIASQPSSPSVDIVESSSLLGTGSVELATASSSATDVVNTAVTSSTPNNSSVFSFVFYFFDLISSFFYSNSGATGETVASTSNAVDIVPPVLETIASSSDSLSTTIPSSLNTSVRSSIDAMRNIIKQSNLNKKNKVLLFSALAFIDESDSTGLDIIGCSFVFTKFERLECDLDKPCGLFSSTSCEMEYVNPLDPSTYSIKYMKPMYS